MKASCRFAEGVALPVCVAISSYSRPNLTRRTIACRSSSRSSARAVVPFECLGTLQGVASAS